MSRARVTESGSGSKGREDGFHCPGGQVGVRALQQGQRVSASTDQVTSLVISEYVPFCAKQGGMPTATPLQVTEHQRTVLEYLKHLPETLTEKKPKLGAGSPTHSGGKRGSPHCACFLSQRSHRPQSHQLGPLRPSSGCRERSNSCRRSWRV